MSAPPATDNELNTIIKDLYDKLDSTGYDLVNKKYKFKELNTEEIQQYSIVSITKNIGILKPSIVCVLTSSVDPIIIYTITIQKPYLSNGNYTITGISRSNSQNSHNITPEECINMLKPIIEEGEINSKDLHGIVVGGKCGSKLRKSRRNKTRKPRKNRRKSVRRVSKNI